MEIKIKREGGLPDDFVLSCPNCGNTFRPKFADCVPEANVKCPFCPAEFKFPDESLKSLGEALADLRNSIKD